MNQMDFHREKISGTVAIKGNLKTAEKEMLDIITEKNIAETQWAIEDLKLIETLSLKMLVKDWLSLKALLLQDMPYTEG